MIGETNPNAWLKRMKRELGLKAAHKLLAMAASNDPFNKGTAGDFEKAKWFARVKAQFGYPGIHLRRLHYRMIHSEQTLTLWDDETEYLKSSATGRSYRRLLSPHASWAWSTPRTSRRGGTRRFRPYTRRA